MPTYNTFSCILRHHARVNLICERIDLLNVLAMHPELRAFVRAAHLHYSLSAIFFMKGSEQTITMYVINWILVKC